VSGTAGTPLLAHRTGRDPPQALDSDGVRGPFTFPEKARRATGLRQTP
jgi:hypothetical protein